MPQHAEEQQWKWNTTPWTRIWQPNWILLKNNIILYKMTEGLTSWKNNKPYSDKHFNGQPSLQLFTLFNLTARAILIVNLLQQRLSALLSHVDDLLWTQKLKNGFFFFSGLSLAQKMT